MLNRSGYARYDESTARMLEATTTLVIERWRGDLRNLREEAGRKEAGERALLKQCKGIGDVGADIFFREVQGVWPELRPFLDARALRAAERLGLGSTPKAVARHVDDAELPRLAAALVRVDRVNSYREVIG